MDWVAIIFGIILLIPLAIFLIRRFAGILALALGLIGVLCLFSKQYIGAVIMFVIAFFLTKIVPPMDPNDDYL